MGLARSHPRLAGSACVGGLTLSLMLGTGATADDAPSEACDPARVACQTAEGAPARAVRLELLRTAIDAAARVSDPSAETELVLARRKLDAEELMKHGLGIQARTPRAR